MKNDSFKCDPVSMFNGIFSDALKMVNVDDGFFTPNLATFKPNYTTSTGMFLDGLPSNTTGGYVFTDGSDDIPYEEKSFSDENGTFTVGEGKKSYPNGALAHVKSYSWESYKPTNKLPKQIVSSSFPPSNVFITSDNGLKIELACSGYKKSEIKMETGKQDPEYPETDFRNYITVTLAKEKVKDEKMKEIPLQLGIKIPDGESKIHFFIDPKKYDIASSSAVYEDGILTINVQKNQNIPASKEIKIS